MRVDKSSLEILKRSPTPSFFRVNILKNEDVYIEEELDDNVYGDILIYSNDIGEAFDFAIEHKDTIDYLLFFNPDEKNLRTIAAPEEKKLTIEEIFNKIGGILKDFEKRDEQINLSKKIKNCLNKNMYGIFEAPTGTGKSLAYLIPAILHAKENKEKVVISTNTINLQRQLIEKDLPILKSILEFKAELALGRANYLCKRKLDTLFEKGNVFLFEDDSYKKLKEFAETSKTGLKSDFFDSSSNMDNSLWESVYSTSLTCAHSKCPYYRNRCFYYKSKAKLDSANLIIANHHIVLSDALMKDAGVLPDYDYIVFDEAHNLEKNATSYFTKTISTSELTRLLDMLYSKKKKQEYGLLADMDKSTKEKEVITKAKNIIKDTISIISNYNLPNEFIVSKKFEDNINQVSEVIIDAIKNVCLALDKYKDNIDISGIIQSLNEAIINLEIFMENSDDTLVKWIKKTTGYIHFNMTPISVSESLQDNIYGRVKGAIFTSATISVNSGFEFFKKTVGVDNAYEFIAKNNFDYESSSKLVIIKNVPMPDSENYTNITAKSIIYAAEALKNRNIGMLILFTSYKTLNAVYDLSFDSIQNLGFNVLRQGDFDNFETLKAFKSSKSFLFATSSFWEGIDVKGDALSVVFITRLPFEVPNTPIERSRYELMKKQGMNAFLEYSLPKAVLKFKQGFGRLIRDKKDRGIIIVSDSRIINKSYGKMFIDSLPKIKKEVINTNEIKNSVSDFFGSF